MKKTTQFYLRRLHGISGIYPIGYFLLYHLKDSATFSSKGIIFAVILLWLPLAFHSLYGAFITYEGSINSGNYGYWRNYMYLFQRVTGGIIFLFLVTHIYVMKTGSFAPGGLSNVVLLVGVIASVLHLCNGLFGFLIDMGVIVGEKAQRTAVYLSGFAFILLAVYGIQKFSNFVG